MKCLHPLGKESLGTAKSPKGLNAWDLDSPKSWAPCKITLRYPSDSKLNMYSECVSLKFGLKNQFFLSDYSPLNMASHPSFRGGLISSSNQIILSSITTAISLFILLLMHHRIWANFFRWYVFTMGSKSFWRCILISMNLWVYRISSELTIFYRLNELFMSMSSVCSKAQVQIMTCSFWPGFVDISMITVFLQTEKYLIY